MKLFFVSLITLALICGLCTWGTIHGTQAIDALIGTLDEAKSSGEEVPYNAAKICEKLYSKWENCSFMLSMFLPHHHLDEVKEKLVQLKAYASTDEFAEWRDATLVLKEELFHIRGLIGISADNIL